MLRVGQLDQHLVLVRGQPDYDDCIAVAKVPPMPRQVVDGNMQMADPRRYAERLAPSTGKMRKFSTRYGMRTAPWANGPISGGFTTSLGAGSFSMATSGVLALWVKAGALLRPFNPSLGLCGTTTQSRRKHDGFPGHRPQPNRVVATSPISSRPPHI